MKHTKCSSVHLGTIIESALALLDPKGQDTQVSRAMSIVRMAFSETTLDPRVSPRSLYENACEMYPADNLFLNCDDS